MRSTMSIYKQKDQVSQFHTNLASTFSCKGTGVARAHEKTAASPASSLPPNTSHCCNSVPIPHALRNSTPAARVRPVPPMPPETRTSKRLQESASVGNENRRKRVATAKAKPSRRSRRSTDQNGASPPPLRKKTTLTDLPDELLLMVFGHLSLTGVLDGPLDEPVHWYEDRMALFQHRCNDLRQICLASKGLCRIVQPMLYEVCNCLNWRHKRRQFLRTIVSRPRDLGAAVREVHLRHEPEHPEEGLHTHFPEIMQAARTVDIEMSRSFMSALRTGRCEAEIALALSQMPNVNYLNVCLDERWLEHYNWTFRLLRQSLYNMSTNGTCGPFANLQRIETSYGSMDFGYNPVFISEFAALPALNEIMIKGAWSGETACGVSWNPRDNSSSITTINLDASAVTNSFVHKLFRACKAPKTFIYSWGGPPPTDSMSNFTEFMNALKLGRNTLETIRLDVVLKANYFESLAIDNEYLPPLGSFKDFSRLRELEIPGHLLLGSPLLDWEHFDGEHWPALMADLDYRALTDVFPPSLERLIIDCMGLEEDVTFILPFLNVFAQTCAQTLPKLRFVKLIVVDEDDFPLLEKVKEALVKQGVDVQVKDFIDEEGWEDDFEVRYGDDGRKKITSRLIEDILHLWPGAA